MSTDRYNWYKTLSEVERVVRSWGIRSNTEYRAKRKDDPRLPGSPDLVYWSEWKSWNDLWGAPRPVRYSTYKQAQKAAKRLGIKTAQDYSARRAEDSLLPGDPRMYNEFVGWHEFLGTSKFKNFYGTLREARDAAHRLGLYRYTEYHVAKGYKLDARLPANPQIIYSESWVSWECFLSSSRPPFYASCAEASAAARGLAISRASDYAIKRKLDPRLPCNPKEKYKSEWLGWANFLLVNVIEPRYEIFSAAREAARRLECKSVKDYISKYKEDYRLRRLPKDSYPNEWRGWQDYLGYENPRYQTLDQVRRAARALNIKSKRDYDQRYKKDPGLPSNPHDIFASEWHSWEHFFLPVVYGQLKDVREAVCKLNILNSVDYKKRFKLYPPLPAHPERVFKAEWISWYDLCELRGFYSYEEAVSLIQPLGLQSRKAYKDYIKAIEDVRFPKCPEKVYSAEWVDEYTFLGKVEPFTLAFIPEDYNQWRSDIERFLKVARSTHEKRSSLCKFVIQFVIGNKLGITPADFLANSDVGLQLFKHYVSENVAENNRRSFSYAVNEFIRYLIREDFTLEDDETGELVAVRGITNPLRGSEAEYSGPANLTGYSESSKPALAYQYVSAMREWIAPSSCVCFSDLKHLHIFDADWVEVSSMIVAQGMSDTDLVWKEVGGKTLIWSPIKWMLTLALVSVPARGRQLAYSDSGEGDAFIPEFNEGRVVWKKNQSQMAGITNGQGFVKRYKDDQCGMHFTSNKTSLWNSSYSVPWIPESLVFWMIKLREWQRKYNPVARPMPWFECVRTALNESQRKSKGSNFFLFREFGGEEPSTVNNSLQSRVAAALYFSQPKDLLLATRRGGNSNLSSLNTYSSYYTPHSMRVSLITAYVLDFGLPIEITMKIAGHSSIVMNLYYVKLGSVELRRRFDEGEKRALQRKAHSVQSMIEQGRVDKLSGELVANNQQAIEHLVTHNSPGSYLFRDCGFCPFAGSRCDDGGGLGKGEIYYPVPGGYLGSQNCVRCRHFVTGPAFIGGLMSLANEISLQANHQQNHYEELQQKALILKNEIRMADEKDYQLVKSGGESVSQRDDGLEIRHRKTLSECEASAKKLDVLMCDIQAVVRLIKEVEHLIVVKSESPDNDRQLLIVQTGHELNLVLDEVSYFQQVSEVCENAEIYESASAEHALAPRSQMLDRMLDRCSVRGRMFNLNKNQQLLIGNQIARLLLSRLKTWERVDSVVEGKLKLQDIFGPDTVVLTEISNLFVSAGPNLNRESIDVAS